MARARVLVDISVLATDACLRGIGRYVSELARGLAAAERDFGALELAFLERVGFDGRPSITHDLEPALARLAQGPRLPRLHWAYPMRLFAGLAARKAGAELIHFPAPGATPLALLGARSVVTCHDLIPYRYPEHYARWEDGFGWGRRALDRRRYCSPQQVIAISRATARDLEQLLGLGPERVSVVLSGIDASRWSAAAQADDAQQLQALGLTGQRFIVYVGDADWRKNSAGMLRALGVVRASEPDLKLVWLGKLSAEREQALRAEAEALGVAEGCAFLGYVSDAALRAAYRAALATLFVSRVEGFGYPVLEAMASGCPVVTSNLSSLPEVGGDAALLVDPEQPAQIADALLLLARHPEKRREMRERGLERAKTFSLEAQARETLEVYRAQLAAPTRPATLRRLIPDP
jgi:glycosyltransferase involved in cell wall biosynthesis